MPEKYDPSNEVPPMNPATGNELPKEKTLYEKMVTEEMVGLDDKQLLDRVKTYQSATENMIYVHGGEVVANITSLSIRRHAAISELARRIAQKRDGLESLEKNPELKLADNEEVALHIAQGKIELPELEA
ncbi:MAG: hypothetical protein WCX27_00340 [Candidatus Paceibacterota bacterium]|jgi:hypothetical protein